MPNPWSIPGINARLTELHPDRTLSFRSIAIKLNEEFGTHLSRDACIGRADRLKLEKRPSPIVPKLPKHRLAAPGKTFADLNLDDCRWPFGELAEKPVLFCGRPVRAGSPWCETHHRKVYVPIRARWA